MSASETKQPVFYYCPICGNTVEMVMNSGRPLTCCGQEMMPLLPGTTDGASEKHVPVFSVHDNKVKVKVGSVLHPMTLAHHIEWVELLTDKGIQRKSVFPKDNPEVCFTISKHETPLAVYAYCNLHGLWKAS